MSEHFVAGQADLVFRAETGTAKANVESLRRDFRTATAGMSEDTLKLTVAQEKLDKALVRHGPASTQAKQAELAYRREVESTTTQVKRQDAALEHQQRTLSQASRGAAAGSGAFRGLGRSIAFASSAYLGTAGLIYAVRTSIDAASNLSEQINKNEVVFESSARGIIDWSKTTATGIGVARDQALEATGVFGNMLIPLGVGPAEAAKMSRSLVQLAADMASFNNASPEETLQALRSGLAGEVEPLRKFGVSLSELRLKQEAVKEGLVAPDFKGTLDAQSKALAAYGLIFKDTAKAQGDYARTADGLANSQRTLSAEIRDTSAALGTALLPGVTDITHELRDWLADSENQARIQRDVNAVVKTGGEVARGLATGLGLIKDAAEPVVDALGGIENAAQAALVLGLVLKAKRAATSFGFIAGASAVTKAKVVADAAQMEAALDAATRPRVVPVTVVQRIGQYGNPIPAAGGVPSKGSKIPYALGFNGPTIVAAAVITASGAGFSPSAYDPKSYPNIARLLAKIEAGGALTTNERSALAEFGGKSISQLTAAQLQRLNANLVGQATGLGGDRNRPNQGRAPDRTSPTRKPPRTTASGDGLTPLQRLQVAEATPGNELGDARALLNYYANVVKNGKLQGKALYDAKIDLANQQAKVQSILDGIASDKAAAAAKKQATIDKQNAATKRAQTKLVEAVRRANSSGPYATTHEGFDSAGKSPAEAAAAAAKAAKTADGPATKAEIAASVSEALREQVQINQRYAPNFQLNTGRLETHGYESVQEARMTRLAIERLSSRTSFPASGYAIASAEAAQ